MKSDYQQTDELTELVCYSRLLSLFDEPRWREDVKAKLDLIVLNFRSRGRDGFGRIQAAMVLYRMIEKGFYPSRF